MTPEDHVSEALRARVLAVAGGADVQFERLDLPGIIAPRLHFRVWVGPMGNGARAYNGGTLTEAVENAMQALTPDDPLPW